MQTTTDWRAAIADAARPVLDTDTAVIVRLQAREAPEVVSRVYRASDYDGDTKQMRRVACRRQTQMLNGSEWNHYVVARYADRVVVWTGMYSVLLDTADDNTNNT